MPISKEKLLEITNKYPGEEADKTFGADLLTLIKYMSSSRAVMHITHEIHKLMLVNPEIPGVMTGYEKGFGYFADSYKVADSNYIVIANIPRHSKFPAMKFTLVIQDTLTKIYDVVEVCHYEKLSEAHGYMRELSPMTDRMEGSIINKGEYFYKASTLDKYANYCTGINAKVAYISRLDTTEDAICISKSFAEKVKFHTVDDLDININTNEIMLNLYGDEDNYKFMPDIGEEVPDTGILCRKRKLEFAKASSSMTNSSLMNPQSNDVSYKSAGKVVDIDIRVNNRLELESDNNRQQLLDMYLDQLRYNKEIVNVLERIINNKRNSYTFDLKFLYQKAKLYVKNSDITSKTEYKYADNNGLFEFVHLNVKVAKLNHLGLGYKLTNRFASKSVIADILDDEYMPRDVYGNVADIILSPPGVIGRANPGQLYEHELNFCAERILDYMKNKLFTTEDRYKLYIKFIRMVNKEQAETVEKLWNSMDIFGRDEFINSIFEEGRIIIRQPPFHGTITLEQLEELYDEFNIHPNYIRTRIEFENVPDMEKRYITNQEYNLRKAGYEDYVYNEEKIKETASGLEDIAKSLNDKNYDKKNTIITESGEKYYKPKDYFSLSDLFLHKEKETKLIDSLLDGVRLLIDEKDKISKKEFLSDKVFMYINEKGNLVRDIRSDEKVVIAEEYFYLLKQTAEAGFSARSIGPVSQSYIPTKSRKYADTEANSISPIKYGEMEVTNALRRIPPEIVHRFMAERATNLELRREINKNLLLKNPFKLHDVEIPDDEIVGDIPAKILAEYLRAIGCYIVETNEKDPNDFFDNLPIEDIVKYFKEKNK